MENNIIITADWWHMVESIEKTYRGLFFLSSYISYVAGDIKELPGFDEDLADFAGQTRIEGNTIYRVTR
jgi:hypothetical protein